MAAFTIEAALRLRLLEMLNGDLSESDSGYIPVYGIEPVGAEGTCVFYKFEHSRDAQNIRSDSATASWAMVNIFIAADTTEAVWDTSRKIRLGLFTIDANYWPLASDAANRRRVRYCRASAGGMQDYAKEGQKFVEGIAAEVCFDDSDQGHIARDL